MLTSKYLHIAAVVTTAIFVNQNGSAKETQSSAKSSTNNTQQKASKPSRGTKSDIRPNVVVFFIDDMGWRDLSCYGSQYHRTPNIDKLAQSGALYTDAYSACTVSSPSRAALMTGKYPARLHLTDWIAGHDDNKAKLLPPEWTQYLPLEEVTVAERLKAIGYKTWHVGKWHLGDDPKYYPLNQGFDVNIGGNAKGQPNKNAKLGYNGYFAPFGLENMPEGQAGDNLTDKLTDHAVALIENNQDGPFYLNFAHYAVHTPLSAHPDKQSKYEALADAGYFQHNAAYAAIIESVDESVARVLEAIRKKGELENTLIIFTSDNGALYSVVKSNPLRKGKGSEYEGGTRVPLIISWGDKIKSGDRITTPVITMDVTATIIDAAGLPQPKDIDGISLLKAGVSSTKSQQSDSQPHTSVPSQTPVPTLSQSRSKSQPRSDSKLNDRPLFWHYPHYHPGGALFYSAVRVGDWKLIEQLTTKTVELYNLKDDISESVNLSSTNPKKVYELLSLLHKWKKEVGAQSPRYNPDYDPSAKPWFIE